MLSVVVFGGCVSRDIFSFSGMESFAISNYYARSNFASAFSGKATRNVDVENIESPFQRRCVEMDLKKKFASRLAISEFDFLLVDFISNRFKLAKKGDEIVTISSEILKSGFIPKNFGFSVVPVNSEAFFSLWKQGFERFCGVAEGASKLERIVINKLFFAYELSDGSLIPGYERDYIERFNDLLEKCYGFAESMLPSASWLRFSNDSFIGATEHKWGVSPFHYVDDLYLEAGRQLREIARV